MTLFLEAGFVGTVAERLNCVRKFKGLVHLSDGATCDGRQLEASILTDEPCTESSIAFPLERHPTQADI